MNPVVTVDLDRVCVDGQKAVRACMAGNLLHLASFNLANDTARAKFAKSVAEKLGSEHGPRLLPVILDRLLELANEAAKEGKAKATDGLGKDVEFENVEPWPEPVDLNELLGEIAKLFERYVVLPPGAATTLALWVAVAHVFERFEFTLRLVIQSPEKRCGKTTVLRILEALVPRPLRLANVTAAFVFRVIEADRPTLLIDEADTFLRENQELRGVINSGHERGGRVGRCVGDEAKPKYFATFAPVVLASIRGVPDTIEDRAVKIPMRRKLKDERVDLLRSKQLKKVAQVLVRKLVRWSVDAGAELERASPQIPTFLNDREADGWHGLFAVAEAAGGDWPVKAIEAVKVLCRGQEAEAESMSVQLLRDLKAVFSELHADALGSEVLLAKLNDLAERPWKTISKGRELDAMKLARLLKPFGVRSRDERGPDGKVRKTYRLEDLDEAFARYIPETPVPGSLEAATPLQANRDGGCRAETTRNREEPVAAAKNPPSPMSVGLSRRCGSEEGGTHEAVEEEAAIEGLLGRLSTERKEVP